MNMARIHPVHRLSHRKRQQGFSLIELLIYVAIITLLLGIMIPSLLLAKTLAKRAKCQASLKAIGVAAALYQADHKEYVPVSWQNFPASSAMPWKSWQSCLLPYASSFMVFNCPSAVGTGSVSTSGRQVLISDEKRLCRRPPGVVSAWRKGALFMRLSPGARAFLRRMRQMAA